MIEQSLLDGLFTHVAYFLSGVLICSIFYCVSSLPKLAGFLALAAEAPSGLKASYEEPVPRQHRSMEYQYVALTVVSSLFYSILTFLLSDGIIGVFSIVCYVIGIILSKALFKNVSSSCFLAKSLTMFLRIVLLPIRSISALCGTKCKYLFNNTPKYTKTDKMLP